MSDTTTHKIRAAVLDHYRETARNAAGGAPSCCGSSPCGPPAQEITRLLGYRSTDLEGAPAGSNLGLGCGNPHLSARLEPGQVVLDLGSGPGLDCFLAARQVGPNGRVIGVDMTPEMIALSREKAAEAGVDNVSFRLGEIENLPVGDASVDVIISNCVVNLSPDKEAVYREAFRVLRPGGRLAISDVVAHAPLPDELRADLDMWASCASGASSIDDVTRLLHEIGFSDVRIGINSASRDLIREWSPSPGLESLISAAVIEAVKPTTGSTSADGSSRAEP